jgi:hypothetical protein
LTDGILFSANKADSWMDIVYPWDLILVNEIMLQSIKISTGGTGTPVPLPSYLPKRVESLMNRVQMGQLDKATLAFAVSNKVNSIMRAWSDRTDTVSLLEDGMRLIDVFRGFNLDLNLRPSQNIYYFIGRKRLHEMIKRVDAGDRNALDNVRLNERETYMKAVATAVLNADFTHVMKVKRVNN